MYCQPSRPSRKLLSEHRPFFLKSQHYNGINCGPTPAKAFLRWPKPPCFREDCIVHEKAINWSVWMKEICTLLVKSYIICPRMQRVNLHDRPSIIQVGVPPVIRCVHWTMQSGVQGSQFPTVRRPWASKTTSWASGFSDFSSFISYKQIKEFLYSWSWASDDFEKRQALGYCRPGLPAIVMDAISRHRSDLTNSCLIFKSFINR